MTIRIVFILLPACVSRLQWWAAGLERGVSFGLPGRMAATSSNVATGSWAGAIPGLGQALLADRPFSWRARVADLLVRGKKAAMGAAPAMVEAATPIERALRRYSYEQASLFPSSEITSQGSHRLSICMDLCYLYGQCERPYVYGVYSTECSPVCK